MIVVTRTIDPAAWCIFFQGNSRVETLDLEENALGGEGTCYIADMIKENSNITGLVSRFALTRAHPRCV